MSLSADQLARAIVDQARVLGFHRVGLVPVSPSRQKEAYQSWLEAGYAGEMHYLHSDAHVQGRADPGLLLAGAKTIVVVALSYGAPDRFPLRTSAQGKVARYARGDDYHTVLKHKLAELARHVAQVSGRVVLAKACVDTAPLLERELAERSGIGFVAKNTMLIAPGLGSYVLLGELLLDVEASPTAPDSGVEAPRRRCGECRACLDACPTGAFVDAYVLDARRCISYLTIEHVGTIPRELRPLMGTLIFGCDICQEVCPFNAAAAAGQAEAPAPELDARDPVRAVPDLCALLALGAAQFRRYVRRTAMRRIHHAQFKRNLCIALGNSGPPGAIPALRRALGDRHPLVRAHAAWALGRLGDRDGLVARRTEEADASVREEIDLALSTS
jgi:epoxyqueuosine reductase